MVESGQWSLVYFLWLHKEGKLQLQTKTFFGNKNPVFVTSTVVPAKISKKTLISSVEMLPQASKQKETIFLTRKILQNRTHIMLWVLESK